MFENPLSGTQNPSAERPSRGRYMGKGLERLTRGLGSKIKIHIVEGKKRPEAPIEAAKLASEAGIVLRHHIPVLPKWKEYQKDTSLIENYVGKLAGQFDMDTNSNAVLSACADMLKVGQRQLRHRLKKLYFDGVPVNQVRSTSPVECMTDDQWRALVDMWSNPKHKEKCEANRLNRSKVKYQQRTGSRSYIAHFHALKSDKYKDVEPTTVDLFKDCHCSKKKGYSEPVKEVIAEMDALMAEPVEVGQEPMSPTAAVAQVLPNSTFLENIGILSGSRRRRRLSERAHELEAELEMERGRSTVLEEKLDCQEEVLDELRKQIEEANNDRNKQAEEIDRLKKAQEDMDRFLRRFFEKPV
ncbi:hypothetical protein EJB05_46469, partial [Eragrostis curvula]